jgi:hypothetical protein
MYLRNGIRSVDDERALRECARAVGDVLGSAFDWPQLKIKQNNYLQWVMTTESQLRNIFIDPDVWNSLHSERYWRIYDLSEQSPRADELINTEARDQATRLVELANRLKKLADRLNAVPGQVTVLDTHILLHFQPPIEVNWQEIVGAPQVRLVLPLRVIEELDTKKYTARDDTADRARRLLSQLREQLAPGAGGPTLLRLGVTIEVPVDDEPRLRTLDADHEILEVCREIQSGGQPVVLVTDDTGMTLRANALDITVINMPEKYLRRRPQLEPE